MRTNQRNLYRARDGLLLGVCKGIARYADISVVWVRIAVFIFMITTGFLMVAAVYFAAALIMKPEPVIPFRTEADQEFYNSYVSSRSMALNRLKRTFDSLDRRIRRMEDIVTAKDYEWEKKLNESEGA